MNKSMPGRDADVSVIIPVFNRPLLVQEAIQSALDQRDVSVEVIVVDDGSTDETPQVLARIASNDSRVKHIRQSNSGPSAARNAGLAAARGRYIQFLDSDDLLGPGKLLKQAAVLGANPEIDFCYCWVQEFSSVPGDRETMMGQRDRYPTDLLSRFVAEFPFHTSAPLYHVSICKAAGPWCESLRNFEDWEFNLRVAAASRAHNVIPETLAFVRAHNGARLSLKCRAEQVRDYSEYLDLLLRNIAAGRLPDSPALRHAIYAMNMRLAAWAIRADLPEDCRRRLGKARVASTRWLEKACVGVTQLVFDLIGGGRAVSAYDHVVSWFRRGRNADGADITTA